MLVGSWLKQKPIILDLTKAKAFQHVNFRFWDKAADNFSTKSVGGTMTGEIDKDQFGNARGLTK